MNPTAHKILDAAEHFTQRDGFNAFSYKDLQKVVGVKTSSIHYYFPTKQDLAFSMAERYRERFQSQLHSIEQSTESGIEQLQRLTSLYVAAIADDKFCMCGMLASDVLSLPDSVSEQLDGFFSEVEGWIEKTFSTAAEQNEITKSSDFGVMSQQLLSILEGGMLIARVRKQPEYLTNMVSAYLDNYSD